MRKEQILILALIGIAAISLYTMNVEVKNNSQDMFKSWMTLHGKNYGKEEFMFRFNIWAENLKYVQEHNARYIQGLETYDLEMNQFADLSSKQFGIIYLMASPQAGGSSGPTSKCNGKQAPTDNLPAQVDWSGKNAVTGVKNQGQCGSCWAFSTTGSLEGAKFISTKELASFSQQQLVDCSHSYGNNGCGGGWMNSSFFYVADNGISLQGKYPYRGVGGACKYQPKTDIAWIIKDCVEVKVDSEISLMGAVNQQPVSVAIQANHLSFQLYKSGVYTGNCGTNLDHGVLAVGYGTSNGKKYWKVKNSWGSSWGSQGYILIERTGDGKGKCGIQMAASFPVA